MAAASRRLRPGQHRTIAIGATAYVVWRRHDGVVEAAPRACPHMGADLAKGRVTDDGLRCGFHGHAWRDGASQTAAPMACAPVAEQDGLVWLGHQTTAPLPADLLRHDRHMILPPQRLDAHPFDVLANGFDLGHIGPVHGATVEAWRLDERPHRLDLHVSGRLGKGWMRRLFGLAGKHFDATFTLHGATIHTITLRAPVQGEVLFTCRPTPQGTRTQTVLAAPRGMLRLLALVWSMTLEDIPWMESMGDAWNVGPGDAIAAQTRRYLHAQSEEPCISP